MSRADGPGWAGAASAPARPVRWSEHRRHLGHRTNKTHSSGPLVRLRVVLGGKQRAAIVSAVKRGGSFDGGDFKLEMKQVKEVLSPPPPPPSLFHEIIWSNKEDTTHLTNSTCVDITRYLLLRTDNCDFGHFFCPFVSCALNHLVLFIIRVFSWFVCLFVF